MCYPGWTGRVGRQGAFGSSLGGEKADKADVVFFSLGKAQGRTTA